LKDAEYSTYAVAFCTTCLKAGGDGDERDSSFCEELCCADDEGWISLQLFVGRVSAGYEFRICCFNEHSCWEEGRKLCED
jgi:hypothetical protein